MLIVGQLKTEEFLNVDMDANTISRTVTGKLSHIVLDSSIINPNLCVKSPGKMGYVVQNMFLCPVFETYKGV